MAVPVRKHLPTSVDHLQWMISDDGSRTLHDLRIDETFHGGCGAVSESIVVYLLNSGALDRLENGHATAIFELGLGTATNFLLTAAVARMLDVRLDYLAVEPNLLPVSILSQLDLEATLSAIAQRGVLQNVHPNACVLMTDDYQLALAELTRDFLTGLSRIGDSHETRIGFELGSVSLTLYREAWTTTGPQECRVQSDESVDVVYFDAFSPANCPDLWTRGVLETVFCWLVPGGVMATYCVKGDVRRTLAEIGFEVKKLPGPPGGKREVLVATRPKP